MAKFARLTSANGSGDRTVIEVIDASSAQDVAKRYHPTIASQFMSVPADTIVGSVLNGSTWTVGEAPTYISTPAPVVYRTLVSPLEFKMMFASEERLAIADAKSYTGSDAAKTQLARLVADWWSIVDDVRLTGVDLSLEQTKQGLDLLVAAEILSPERCTQIGLGLPE